MNYIIGFVFFGAAAFIGLKSRGNVDETATETFGTLGVILLLVIIGYSFIKSAEAERVRKAGKKKTYGPPKGVTAPPKAAGAPKPPTQSSGGLSSFGDSEAAEKIAYLVMGLMVLGMGFLAFNYFFVKSDFEKLALLDRPKSVAKGKARMDPLLDKMASQFDLERSDMESELLQFCTENEDDLKDDSLRPSGLCREILGSARKNSEFEALATKIIQQKPAARLARLHQKKPVFGKYPQEGEFKTYLGQLAKKTGLEEEEIATTLIRNWKLLFSKKKKNRKFNLLWFVKHVNNKTKKQDGAAWKKAVTKMRKSHY